MTVRRFLVGQVWQVQDGGRRAWYMVRAVGYSSWSGRGWASWQRVVRKGKGWRLGRSEEFWNWFDKFPGDDAVLVTEEVTL